MTDRERAIAARPGARPVPGRRLPAALPLARLAARTAPRGARHIAETPPTGSLDAIDRCGRALLVTYRRDGTPVPTAVWAAREGGALYVRTERTSGKVKRLRRDPRLLVAPCTARGSPLGPRGRQGQVPGGSRDGQPLVGAHQQGGNLNGWNEEGEVR